MVWIFYEDDNTIRMLLIAQRIKDKSMMCEENDYEKWTIATHSLTGADTILDVYGTLKYEQYETKGIFAVSYIGL